MKKLALLSELLLIVFLFSTSAAQNREWITYTYGGNIRSIAAEGHFIWCGTYRGGLVKLDMRSGNLAFYNKANSSLPDNDVYSIAIDGSGNKWIGTWGGLAKFDGTNWTVYNTSNSGLPDNHVLSIAIDESGNKWIGTRGGGLAKFNGTNWTVYNASNSNLPDNWIRSIAIDGSGHKWIGTEFGGLAVYREGGVVVAVEENPAQAGLPRSFLLEPNYPNPFNCTRSEIGAAIRLSGKPKIWPPAFM
jgi:streptogramin lyase